MKAINIFTDIPELVITKKSKEVLDFLKKPTLFHVDNKKEKTIFISGSLHGNEPTGFLVIKKLLRKYKNGEIDLPFNLLCFVGNIEALAKEPMFSHRFLEGQKDLNRVWEPDTTHPVAREVLDYIENMNIIGGVDIHNNSGNNPVYGVIVDAKEETMKFVDHLVKYQIYYDSYLPTLVHEMSRRGIPFVTVECGHRKDKSSNEHGMGAALKTIEFFSGKKAPISNERFLYENVRRVLVDPEISVTAHDERADLTIRPDIEEFNFQHIPQGTPLAKTSVSHMPIYVDLEGKDVTEEWFVLRHGEILFKQDCWILMATSDEVVMKQDVIFYIAQARE
ncbi:MAG: succinylglutamate desuccinylase/aspartoacylase family protein [Candidatus Nanoarchaeia archaeon]